MNIAEIKGMITNMPWVKTIWVKDGEFYISPVFNGKRVDLKDMSDKPVASEPELEQPTLKKQSKKSKNGTK